MPANAGAVQADAQHLVIVEPVRGSDIPVQLMYVEMVDGVYAPIGLRTPSGPGPFRWCCLPMATAAAAWRWCVSSPRT
jgi:hypothetical protein